MRYKKGEKIMKVKMYINWREEEILTEKEFQNRVNEVVKDIMEDEDEFSRICCGEFNAFELFYMDSKNKNDIEKIESIARKGIESDFKCDGWEKLEIEI
jgi:hypothetical protein